MDPEELDGRREAAQRDAERVKRAAPRIQLLNTPLHRNLDGERGGEPGADQDVDVEPKRVPAPER